MSNELLPVHRFLQTLEIVQREGRHLAFSWGRLFGRPIDAAWVRALDDRPEEAERLEAFVSRFGRMQDTIGDKLLPRWLLALAESPGSQIETLNRAERLGVLGSAEAWLEARNLRNGLVHEYQENPGEFAEKLTLAKQYVGILFDTYNGVREFAATRMDLPQDGLPEPLEPLGRPGAALSPEPGGAR